MKEADHTDEQTAASTKARQAAHKVLAIGSRPIFQPLEDVNKPTVPTDQAAYYLDRQPQTLRCWACDEDGPLRPLRIRGRLAWPVADIRRLLGVA